MLLLTIQIAAAASVSLADMQAWMPSLVTSVEREVGRDFFEVPRLDVETQAKIPALAAMKDGVDGQAPRHAVAVYVDREQTIFVVSDNVVRIFGGTEDDRELLAPYLRCVLTHELVHALQHQYGTWVPGEADPRGEVHAALEEGQAVLAARRLCEGSVAAEFAEIVMGNDLTSSRSPDDVQAFRYGFGARFMERVYAAGGWEGTWSSLERPPTREALLAVAQTTLAPGWRDPAALSLVAQRLSPAGSAPVVAPTSPSVMMSRLAAGSLNKKYLLPAEGGLSAQVGDVENDQVEATTALAFLIGDHMAATSWVARRRSDIRGGLFFPLFRLEGHPFNWRVRVSRRLQNAGAQSTALVHVPTRPLPYLEAWAVRGNVLVGVVHRGRSRLHDVETAAMELLNAYPDTLPAAVPLDLAPLALTPAPLTLSADYVRSRVIREAERSGAPAAIAVALPLLALVGVESHDLAFDKVYRVALTADGVTLADQVVAVPGWTPAARTASLHVERLMAAKRYADARALLSRLSPTGPEERAWVDGASRAATRGLGEAVKRP